MGSSRLPVSLSNAVQKRPNRSQFTALLNIDLLRNIVFFFFLLRWTRKTVLQLKGRGVFGTTKDAYQTARKLLYGIFFRLPGVRAKVQKDVSEAVTKLENKLVPRGPGVSHYNTLPNVGWSDEQVMAELDKLESMEHTKWQDGKVSGAVYHGGKSLLKVQAQAFEKFAVSNPIHPDVFPGVRKMESEIVAMVLNMFRAPAGSAGVTTSGGTESILMAVLSARNKAYRERGVVEPEMILPETAHTAFRKAGEYFNIKTHLVDCPSPTYQVHLSSVSRLINSNTILLVGSAPNFPHGITDDIPALSRLAIKRSLPLHVDCCLGSFLVPFLARAGYEAADFDFMNKGVTSISCDTHKYGFAPKGSSVVMYRTQALRSYQYFISPDWSGGVYASPSMAGSRPGSLISGTWATLVSVGESGYIDSCHKIVGAAKKIEAAIREHPILSGDLQVIGKPLVSVVGFKSSGTLNIYNIADGMSSKHWHLNALQNPPAMHVAVTLPIVQSADKLISDLVNCVEEEKDKERTRIAEGQKSAAKPGDAAALYGVAGALPDKSIVVELANGFLNTLYKTG